MFGALLAHPQEALHIYSWYIVYVLFQFVAPGCGQQTQPARNIPPAAGLAPPEDEQVMFEIYRGP
jgi:hypothetical protein